MKKKSLCLLTALVLFVTTHALAATNSSSVTPSADTSKWGVEWFLVFSPLIFFLFFFLFTFKWLWKFDLSKALTDSDIPKKTIPNPLYTLADIKMVLEKNPVANFTNSIPPTIDVSVEPRPSLSRLLAFISSVLSIIIGVTVSCFVIYSSLKGGNTPVPSIGDLGKVLLSLGIGTAPYAVNKVSSAVSSKN